MIEHKYPIHIQPSHLEPWLEPGGVSLITPMPGWHNSIFRVDARDGAKYVLRVHVPEEPIGYIEPTLRIVEACSRELPYVPAPVRTRSGELHSVLQGRVAALWPYVDGTSPEEVDCQARCEAARVLAEIHSVGPRLIEIGSAPATWRFAEIDWRENRRWSFSTIGQFLGSGREDLPRWMTSPNLLAELDSELDKIGARLSATSQSAYPLSIAHGDFYPANLLLGSGGVISGVIDWDDARIDWTGWDIANASLEFCAGPGGIGIDGASVAGFIGAYQAAGGTLSAVGREHLPILVRARKVDEVMYSLDSLARLGQADLEYLEASVESWRRLRRLLVV